MKKERVFIVIFLLVFLTFFIKTNAKAESTATEIIGTYAITVPVVKPTKVYVQKEIVDYLKENGIDVKSEKRNWFIKDYYYIANEYIEKIVCTRELKNDVDSLVFMVDELEKRAMEYDKNQYKNIALGYIRSINKDYTDGYLDKWSIVAGDIHESEIRKINYEDSKKIGLRFVDYFAQFIDDDDYNEELHGAIRAQFKRSSPLKLIDCETKNKKIDLIHLFGCIDGIYCKTQAGASFLVGGHYLERDMVSWNGDLQQAAYFLKKAKKKDLLTNESYQKMNFLFNNAEYGCTEDDVLADIDAMNITKMFVDHDNNSIANSINAYYGMVANNKNFRFKTFVKTVTIDAETQKIENAIEKFEYEISYQFNVEKKGDKYSDHHYNRSEEPMFRIMKGDDNEMPSADIRIFVVKSFIEYIEEKL